MQKLPTMKNRWSLKQKMLMLYFSFKDPRTPWYAKLTTLASLLYLVSPIDIIPDVIPFAGYVDDLVIVPALMSMAAALLPLEVKMAAGQRAARNSRKLGWAIWLFVLLLVGFMIVLFIKISGGTSTTSHQSVGYHRSEMHAYARNE